MLLQLLHWAAMAGTVLEGLVLLRMLLLKLHRVYLWLTLYWCLNLIFDVASWYLGFESRQAVMAQIYSWFLFGLVFPLASFNVFEEMDQSFGKLRLLQATRMVSGLSASLLVGAILFAFAAVSDPDVTFLALSPVVIFVSACASIFFLWKLREVVVRQSLPLPRNTNTWMNVFLVLLACQIIGGLSAFFGEVAPNWFFEGLDLVLNGIGIVAMLWTLLRMRAIPGSAAPAALNA